VERNSEVGGQRSECAGERGGKMAPRAGRAEPNPEGYLFALSDYDYEQEQGASREQGAGRGGADLKSELVVVFVRSDPEPSYYIAFA